MPGYEKQTWNEGLPPGISAERLTHLETQFDEFKKMFNAQTILIAVEDDTPLALSIPASRIVGRKAAGNIVALSAAEVKTILGRLGVANLGWAANKLLKGAGVGSNPTELAVPIPLASLDPAVCSETEADSKVATEATARAAAIAAHAVGLRHFPDALAGDELEVSADTERSTPSNTYVKLKEIRLARDGVYRIKFDLKRVNGSATGYGQIYKNDTAIGTEQFTSSTTYLEKSEDIAGWSAGDLLQLYARCVNPTVFVQNLRVYTDLDPAILYWLDHQVVTD